MVKLGEAELPEINGVPLDSASETEGEEVQTHQEKKETPSPKEEEYIDITKKKKRELSEKQRAALERGRAKKLKMNLASKMQRIGATSRKMEEVTKQTTPPSTPAEPESPPPAPKPKRTKRMCIKKKKPTE